VQAFDSDDVRSFDALLPEISDEFCVGPARQLSIREYEVVITQAGLYEPFDFWVFQLEKARKIPIGAGFIRGSHMLRWYNETTRQRFGCAWIALGPAVKFAIATAVLARREACDAGAEPARADLHDEVLELVVI
jgi:hypothetical protein